MAEQILNIIPRQLLDKAGIVGNEFCGQQALLLLQQDDAAFRPINTFPAPGTAWQTVPSDISMGRNGDFELNYGEMAFSPLMS